MGPSPQLERGGFEVPEMARGPQGLDMGSPIPPLIDLQETRLRESGVYLVPQPMQNPAPGSMEALLPYDGCVTLSECPPLSGSRAAPLCWKEPTCHVPPSSLGPSCALRQEEYLCGSELSLSLLLPLSPSLSLTPDLVPGSPLRKPPGPSLVFLKAYCVSSLEQRGHWEPQSGLSQTRA